ncbi:MAG TPA: GTP cyclohydrolase II [Xanthobacteraceae bacterium]
MPKDRLGDLVSGLFDSPATIAVERGVAEFRAGRPVLFAGDERVVAVPVDALDAGRLQGFIGTFARVSDALALRLAVTARRARALGIDAEAPVALTLDGSEDLDAIHSLAADASARRAVAAVPAGPEATAAIELAKLAQRLPALLFAAADRDRELPNAGLLLSVEAEAVARFRQQLVESLRIAAASRVPLEGADQAQFVVFRDGIGGSPAAIVIGKPDLKQPVLVRLHSACLTGDVFGSRRCDCGDQLKLAIARIKHAGGIILYLDQEGRGLGLANKMRAYRLQDSGLDTVDANVTLGFEDDERDYRIAARMLQLLGCRRVVLLTNNPAKLDGLAGAGIEVCGCMPLHAPVNAENRRYLTAKAVRAGHRLDHLWRS